MFCWDHRNITEACQVLYINLKILVSRCRDYSTWGTKISLISKFSAYETCHLLIWRVCLFLRSLLVLCVWGPVSALTREAPKVRNQHQCVKITYRQLDVHRDSFTTQGSVRPHYNPMVKSVSSSLPLILRKENHVCSVCLGKDIKLLWFSPSFSTLKRFDFR